MIKLIRRLFILLFFTALVAVTAGYFYYQKQITQPVAFNPQTIYTIKPGQSTRHIAQKLATEGLLNEPYSMQILARTEYAGQHIKVGDYQFSNGATVRDVLEKIIDGKVIQYKVTMIEGWTFKQYRDALNALDNIEHKTLKMSDDEILQALSINQSHPEGWFYPDTYIYSRTDTDLDILRRAHERMVKELNNAWENRDPEKTRHLQTSYDALILASIIEKETGVGDELATVSSVFHNRMEKGMLLQTDPTIIYGLGDDFDGNLIKAHLQDASNPYNTYVHKGLTPTPISNPAQPSIEAALNPKSTDYLYFVATGNGGHTFTTNYDAHRKAIRDYHRVLRSNN